MVFQVFVDDKYLFFACRQNGKRENNIRVCDKPEIKIINRNITSCGKSNIRGSRKWIYKHRVL